MRLAVKVSDDMAAKISSYAKSFGMSKSAFVAYSVGAHIRSLEQQDGLIGSVKTAISDTVKDSLNNDKEVLPVENQYQ